MRINKEMRPLSLPFPPLTTRNISTGGLACTTERPHAIRTCRSKICKMLLDFIFVFFLFTFEHYCFSPFFSTRIYDRRER